MIHSFDTDHAKAYGPLEAVLIYNTQFWIIKNRANGRHQYEGRTWTYNSIKAFGELFPYLSEKQIRRLIESLIAQKVLMVGNFNSNPYDRTRWFAFVDECLFLDGRSELPKRANEKAQVGRSSVKTDNKPVDKPTTTAEASKDALISANKGAKLSPLQSLLDLGVAEQVAVDWLAHRKAKRAAVTVTVLENHVREAEKAGMSLEDALATACSRGWAGFEAKFVQERQSNYTGPERRATARPDMNDISTADGVSDESFAGLRKA